MIEVHILKVRLLHVINYCYVVAHSITKTAILIDPAWEIETIETVLTKNNLSLAAILLTHHHPDHVHLAPYFAKKYAIPVYMGNEEIAYYHYQCPNLISIDSGALFNIDAISIQPIATPGHTYGGICYLVDHHLFTGDTLFNEGCGMCFGKGANAYQLYASLQKLKQTLSFGTLIYPGHCYGLPMGQTFETVLAHNIYLQFQEAEQFVAYRMRKGQQKLLDFK